MKFEIEVTEDEVRDALERKVRVAIADQTREWEVENYITKKVRELWQSTVDELVQEALSNSDTMKEKIQAAIERKLQAQLARLMKEKKQ